MFEKSWGVVVFAGLAIFVSNFCFSDDSIETISVTHRASLFDLLSEKTSLSYYGYYRGGPIGDLGNSLQPGVDGNLDESSPQSVENFVMSGIKLNRDLCVGVTWHFNYFMMGNPVGTGQDLQMLDPLLTLVHNNILDRNGFKLSGKLLTALPISSADGLKPNHMVTYIQPQLNGTYSIPHTDLTLGLFTYIRGYIHSAHTPDDARSYKLYVAPNANYQLSRTVAFTLWVDLVQATRNGRTGFISGIQNPVADIEPGINWDITPNISLNPILNIYPSNPTLAATSLQAILVAKAF